MPMVDTSVAVATPSTTAARITTGSASAGKAITAARPASPQVARRTWLRSSPRNRRATTKHSPTASTMPGTRPPVNRAAIETPVTEPMVISTIEGGTVSVCAPVAASSATRSPPLAPRAIISGNSAGCDRRHVRRLRARNAGNQIHRADQHIGQSAADMAEQAGQKAHHGPRHPGHLDQHAEEHEQRHREQDQVRHALVHAPDQGHHRHPRGERQVAERRQREGEGDRHAGKHADPDDTDEEHQQVEVSQGFSAPGPAHQNPAATAATSASASSGMRRTLVRAPGAAGRRRSSARRRSETPPTARDWKSPSPGW